jgi:hypothetical protein
MRVYLINGHRDLTLEEFENHYHGKIRKSNAEFPNCIYIVGDNPGCDKYAQDYLRKIGVSPTRVIIYYRTATPPVNTHKCKTKSFDTNNEKNIAMVNHSTHDIVWVRSDEIGSELGKNIERRRTRTKISKTAASILSK